MAMGRLTELSEPDNSFFHAHGGLAAAVAVVSLGLLNCVPTTSPGRLSAVILAKCPGRGVRVCSGDPSV